MSKLSIPPNVPHCENCVYLIKDGEDEYHWRCSNFGLGCNAAKHYPAYCGGNADWKGFISRHTNETGLPIEPPIKKGFWAKVFNL